MISKADLKTIRRLERDLNDIRSLIIYYEDDPNISIGLVDTRNQYAIEPAHGAEIFNKLCKEVIASINLMSILKHKEQVLENRLSFFVE